MVLYTDMFYVRPFPLFPRENHLRDHRVQLATSQRNVRVAYLLDSSSTLQLTSQESPLHVHTQENWCTMTQLTISD